MGCCGDREKDAFIKNDVKWEYVNLNDFKSTSCFTPLAYFYLWVMLFVSISVYAVDTFTCINLLAFNKWAGQIQPYVPLKYSRWIFAGCIILSFVLLIYRWLRALKVMRGGKIAKAYLDPLAVRVECIRMGQGRGWKRFLVFAELTKSRKGADYVALFAYFSFEAWLRILLAEGPRVVINGITLYAYADKHFVPKGGDGAAAAPSGTSPFVQFWKNFGILAGQDKLQMAIICGMLWTCFIWLISAISLAVSVILYLIFLWHHIPSDAGGLGGYCRTKINRRMERIVKNKTDKALKKENELRARQEAQAYREGTAFKREPTLPDIAKGSEPGFPTLSRQTTMTTLPEYTSRPGTAAPPEDEVPPMPAVTPIDGYPPRPGPGPRRHMTNASDASWSSYNSNAPLMGSAGDMAYSPADRVQTPASTVSSPWSARPGPARNFTDSAQYHDRSFTPGPPRPGTSQSYRGPNGSYLMEPIARPGTGMSQRSRNVRQSSDSETLPPPRGMTPVSATPQSATSMNAPLLPDAQRTRPAGPNFNPYLSSVSPIPEHEGRESPAFMTGPSRTTTPMGPPRSFTPVHQPPLPRLQTPNNMNENPYAPGPTATAGPRSDSAGGYIAFNPNANRTASPMRVDSPSYHSFSGLERTNSPSNNRSFGRPLPGAADRHPQNNGNPQPPRPEPAARGGSYDDILDHY